MSDFFNFTESVKKLRGGQRLTLAAIRWLWKHRAEPNNRAKRRRMMREVFKNEAY